MQVKDRLVKEAVESLGFNLLEYRFYSKHPDDHYLKVVLAEDEREFAVWLYNESLDGLFEGNYIIKQFYDSDEEALQTARNYYNNKK